MTHRPKFPVLITWPDGSEDTRDAFNLFDIYKTINGIQFRPVKIETRFNQFPAIGTPAFRHAMDCIKSLQGRIMEQTKVTPTEPMSYRNAHPVVITWPDSSVTHGDAFHLTDLWRNINGKRVRPVGIKTNFIVTSADDDQQAMHLIDAVWSAIMREANATQEIKLTENNATRYPVLIVWPDYSVNVASVYRLHGVARIIDGKHERPKRLVAQFDVETIPEPATRDRIKRQMLRHGVSFNAPPLDQTRNLKRFEPFVVNSPARVAEMQEDEDGRYYLAEDVDALIADMMDRYQTSQVIAPPFTQTVGPGGIGAGTEYPRPIATGGSGAQYDR